MKGKLRIGSHLIARFSYYSLRNLLKLYVFVYSLLAGFWLGVLGEKSYDAIDEIFYSQRSMYSDDEYNTSGLFDWEKLMIEKYFKNARHLLLIAAGGGREVVELSKMGYQLDSYECNPRLVNFGNALLEKEGISARIELLSRDQVPPKNRKYDGVILGWGAYSHIRGSERRKQFISQLNPFLKDKAPLMISFVFRDKDTKQDKIVCHIANIFRFIRRRPRAERGDRMSYNFFHFFTKEEIYSELQACKFKAIDYSVNEYGCAVALKDLSA
jgi:hypothetical protein